MGIQLPYWPVWLKSRQMSPEQVGILLGVAVWARALLSPVVGRWADRSQRSAAIARALAVATALAYVAAYFAHGFGPLLAASLALGLAIAPFNPLVDGLAVSSAAAGRIDYGRVRRWGSAAFVVASVAGGLWLDRRGGDVILWVLVGAAAALAASSTLLPSTPRAKQRRAGGSLRDVLRRPGLKWLLVTAAAIHGSHAVLYAFGTTDWQARGLDGSLIGLLWAEGVVAEILLFSVGDRVARRLGASGLLLVAGLGGVIRWPLTALTASVGALVFIQLLHAATFACLHLGAMTWIRDQVPTDAINRATTLYTGLGTGVALGIGLPLAGQLYAVHGSAAYYAMALASGMGVLGALALARASRRDTVRR